MVIQIPNVYSLILNNNFANTYLCKQIIIYPQHLIILFAPLPGPNTQVA